ncbi:hypothetical protein KSP39_PZI016232 [Platanthera zijinensis]|uniref:Uncharacterized protein n=1 Tax=Platanthera zijinensis TaxID=2320716 RepID=A0AAP0G0Z4_9ASPA
MTLTKMEKKEELARRRREEVDSRAGYTFDESYLLQEIGDKLKDHLGNPTMQCHNKAKHIRISIALPTWRSMKIAHHASMANTALYEKCNFRELQEVGPKNLPYLTAQA